MTLSICWKNVSCWRREAEGSEEKKNEGPAELRKKGIDRNLVKSIQTREKEKGQFSRRKLVIESKLKNFYNKMKT